MSNDRNRGKTTETVFSPPPRCGCTFCVGCFGISQTFSTALTMMLDLRGVVKDLREALSLVGLPKVLNDGVDERLI